jgi:hypothetical protein
MSRTMSFYDLRDALAQPDCPLCRLKARAAGRYLDGLLWESVNDPEVRDQVRRAQGFCHEHGWGLVRPGASLGVAILMHDALQGVLGAMADAHFEALPALSLRRAQENLDRSRPSAATAGLIDRLTPRGRCPACVQAEKMEKVYLTTLVGHLLEEDGLLAAYEASDGLCLAHFRQALRYVRDEATFRSLVNAQQIIWQRLADRLAEAIRKSDVRFRDEPVGDEGSAWLRGIAALSGAQATGQP